MWSIWNIPHTSLTFLVFLLFPEFHGLDTFLGLLNYQDAFGTLHRTAVGGKYLIDHLEPIGNSLDSANDKI